MLHPSQENNAWKWDGETLVRAQGLLSTLTTFQHIISFVNAKNTLHTVKGMAAKLQKNGVICMKLIKWSTTFDAFSKEMCTNIDKEFQKWFKEPKQIADEVGADIKVPCYSARQQHRPNPRTISQTSSLFRHSQHKRKIRDKNKRYCRQM